MSNNPLILIDGDGDKPCSGENYSMDIGFISNGKVINVKKVNADGSKEYYTKAEMMKRAKAGGIYKPQFVSANDFDKHINETYIADGVRGRVTEKGIKDHYVTNIIPENDAVTDEEWKQRCEIENKTRKEKVKWSSKKKPFPMIRITKGVQKKSLNKSEIQEIIK